MARWQGDARGRLERAALDLFSERGYERTTVAQIAERAGLTERSFYRYFADKREVLFAGDELEARLVAAVAAAPEDLTPFDVLLAAFATAQEVFRPRDFLLQRAAVIAVNPQLQERELIKLASLADALTTALESRGVNQRSARLAVDTGLLVLRAAAQSWVAGGRQTFRTRIRDAAEELRQVTSQARS